MIAHKPIRQDNRVFWHISQVYKSTSAMRSRAPPSTPTLAGPTQQPYQDLGPSPHARRQIETGQEPTRSDTDTPGSTAASYQCCPARCATRQPSPFYYSMHPFYTIVRAASQGLQRYPSSHQRAYAARAYPRPLHQLTDATRILFTQHQRHYVQHHLDVCTVTALIDKQAFSDSIANRVRELSWGPKHHDCASPSDALRPGITPCVPRGPLRTQTNSQQSAILYLFSCSEERPQLQDRSCQFWISGTATMRHHAQRYARTSGAAPAQPFALTVHATRSAITAECAACGVDTLTRRTRLLRNAQLSE